MYILTIICTGDGSMGTNTSHLPGIAGSQKERIIFPTIRLVLGAMSVSFREGIFHTWKPIKISHESVGKYIISFMDSSSAYHLHLGRIPLQKKWTCQSTNLKRKKEKNHRKTNINLCKMRRSRSFIFMFSHQNSPVQSFHQEKTQQNVSWLGKCRGPGDSKWPFWDG